MTLPDPLPTLAPRPEAPLGPPTLLEAARGYVEAAKAPNTRRAYRTQWRTFAAWCAQLGREPLPAAPATLALFLTDRAQGGLKVASLGLALSAIRAAHFDAGCADPTANPEVRTVWEGIRRTHGAAPLTADAIRAIVASLPKVERPRHHAPRAVEVSDDGGPLRPHRRRLAGERRGRAPVGSVTHSLSLRLDAPAAGKAGHHDGKPS